MTEAVLCTCGDHVTNDIAAAFTEWDRRQREDPEKFQTDFDRLAGTSIEYGAACAPYFLSLLDELKSK